MDRLGNRPTRVQGGASHRGRYKTEKAGMLHTISVCKNCDNILCEEAVSTGWLCVCVCVCVCERGHLGQLSVSLLSSYC